MGAGTSVAAAERSYPAVASRCAGARTARQHQPGQGQAFPVRALRSGGARRHGVALRPRERAACGTDVASGGTLWRTADGHHRPDFPRQSGAIPGRRFQDQEGRTMTHFWAAAVYALSLVASLLCAFLLMRAWRLVRTRLLLWTAIGFGFLALNN